MRRAFTLIELLVIVAIIGTMVTVAILSVQKGQAYARMRGSVRSVFATVRQARSIALVSGQPSVITFSTKKVDGDVKSTVEIASVKLMETKGGVRARSLNGEWRILDDDDSVPEEVSSGPGSSGEAQVQSSGGVTSEEILFSPVSEEVLAGVCIKVVMADEEFEDSFSGTDEVKRSKISVFSNADFLLSGYKRAREDAAKEREKADKDQDGTGTQAPETEIVEEDKSVAWQTNGRCQAHTIYIYPDGGSLEDAWMIKVDRFGGVKVLEDGEQ